MAEKEVGLWGRRRERVEVVTQQHVTGQAGNLSKGVEAQAGRPARRDEARPSGVAAVALPTGGGDVKRGKAVAQPRREGAARTGRREGGNEKGRRGRARAAMSRREAAEVGHRVVGRRKLGRRVDMGRPPPPRTAQIGLAARDLEMDGARGQAPQGPHPQAQNVARTPASQGLGDHGGQP